MKVKWSGNTVKKVDVTELGRVSSLLSSGGDILFRMGRFGLGDMLMATPALDAFHAAYPKCRITLAVDGEYANGGLLKILEGNPAIARCTTDASGTEYAITTDLSLVVGGGHNPADWVRGKLGLNMTDYRPRYYVTDDEREKVRDGYKGFKVALALDSTSGRRTIEKTDRFMRLINSLDAHSDIKVIDIDRSSGFSIREAVAVLAECDYLITPDSFFLHAAQAVGVRTGAIFYEPTEHIVCKYYGNYISSMGDDRLDDFYADILRTMANKSKSSPTITGDTIGLLTIWCPQGLGYVSQTLRDMLIRLGHRVKVFAIKSPPDRENRSGIWDIGEDVHWSRYVRDQIPIAEVETWVSKNHIDRVIVPEPVQPHIFKIVKAIKDLGVKVYALPMIEITRESEIEKHKKFDKVLCPTKLCHDILTERGLDNLVLVPWGIDAGNVTRRRRGGPVTFFHNAGWGGDYLRKNTIKVVKAFRDLLKITKEPVRLHIHTQKPLSKYPPELKKVIDKVRSRDESLIKVTEGNLPDGEIRAFLERADIAVQPSRFEGLGLTIVEAMAAGCPVVTCDAYNMSDFVKHNLTGKLVPVKFSKMPNNPEPLVKSVDVTIKNLATAMGEMLKDYKRMGKAAYLSVKDSLPVMEASLRAILDTPDKQPITVPESTRKRVLYVSTYFYPAKGGGERSSFEILRDFVELGYRVKALCFKGRDERAFTGTRTLKACGMDIVQSTGTEEQAIRAAVREYQPDLIVTQLNTTTITAKIAKETMVPYAIIFRSFPEHICAGYWRKDCSYFRNHPQADELLDCDISCSHNNERLEANRIAFSGASFIIANSHYSAAVIKKFFSRESTVITPEIDLAPFYEDLDCEKTYVGLNKVNPEKGSAIWFEMIPRFPDLQFKSIGLCHKALVKRYDNLPNAEHLGHLSNPHYARFYQRCSVFLNPMEGMEAYGRSGLEAMACGTPVIASDRGGLRESLEGAAYLVHEYRDPGAWEKALRLVLGDEVTYWEMVKNGFRRIQGYLIEPRKQILKDVLEAHKL